MILSGDLQEAEALRILHYMLQMRQGGDEGLQQRGKYDLMLTITRDVLSARCYPRHVRTSPLNPTKDLVT